MGIVFRPIQIGGVMDIHALQLIPEDYATMGVWDAIQFWRSGKLKEFLEVWDAIQKKDIAVIADELGDVAEMFDLKGMDKEINELAAAIKSGDKWAMIDEGCDPIKLVAKKFRAVPVITTMAAPDHVKDMPHAEAVQWLTKRASQLRDAATDRRGRFLLRRVPEVAKLLRGEMTAAELAAIDPERLATIMRILKYVSWACTAAGMFWPPALLIAQVLNLIIARYQSNHPTGEGIGLDLSDLAGALAEALAALAA